MNFSPLKKTILAMIISIIIHTVCSSVFFLAVGFLISAAAAAIFYIIFSAIVGVIFSKLTKFKTFSSVFPKLGILFALLTGFTIYSYI